MRLGFRKELEAASAGPERDALFQKLVQQQYANGEAMNMAATLEIDATPIEGFDPRILNEELGLREQGLTSVVIAALGYRGADDFNAKLPKTRFPMERVIEEI